MITLEQEAAFPVKEASLGVWFKPFVTYDSTPYTPEGGQNNLSKTFYFNTPGFRIWYVRLAWCQEDIEYYSKNPILTQNIVILPDRDIIVSEVKLLDLQREFETRLMSLGTNADNTSEEEDNEWVYNPPSYGISIKTPSGVEFRSRFSRLEWSLEDEGEIYQYNLVYILDSPVVMEEIEMKIDRLDTHTK